MGPNVSNPLYLLDLSKATREHYRRWRAHYYANITLIDEGIGKILAALESTGALERTLIVFTSDHGDALGDHGLAYKSFFYEWGARVPLIVRGPGVARGKRCASLTSLMDLVPLFYRTFGAQPPPTVQGCDVTPLLADPSAVIRTHVASELLGRAMVRDERFKYVHYAGEGCEFFDLVDDPSERRNLAGRAEYAGEVARLRALLVEHFMDGDANRAAASRVAPDWLRVHAPPGRAPDPQ
jgi:arylsulfatase A-like enzyme